MKQLCSFGFESAGDIIKTIISEMHAAPADTAGMLKELWKETAGEKFLNASRVYGLSKNNTVCIVCSDAAAANELYLEKKTLLNKMKEKSSELGIKIEDIKFDYKKWEAKNYE